MEQECQNLRWNLEIWVEFGSVETEEMCILGLMEQHKQRCGSSTFIRF